MHGDAIIGMVSVILMVVLNLNKIIIKIIVDNDIYISYTLVNKRV